MTLSTTVNRTRTQGNGITVTFNFPYYFLADGDLTVIYTSATGVETTLVLNTDYTVTGAGIIAGGSVTLIGTYAASPPATGTFITIVRDPAATQETDYVENDPFPAETHEQALDRLTMLHQVLSEKIGRSLLLAASSAYSNLSMPDPEATKLLAWKPDLSGLGNYDLASTGDLVVSDYAKLLLADTTAGEALTTLEISAFAQTLLDDADADAVMSTLGTVVPSAHSNMLLAATSAAQSHIVLDTESHMASRVLVNQCRLEYVDTTTLKLFPFCGNRITLYNGGVSSWVQGVVPAAGISLAATGLAVDTLYYVYANDDLAGSIALTASTTAPESNADTGLWVKTGDETRLLVGMVRTKDSGGNPVFASNLVLSRFNNPLRTHVASLASNETETSTSLVELNTSTRAEFLTWGEDAVQFFVTGTVYASSSSDYPQTKIAIDGTEVGSAQLANGAAADNHRGVVGIQYSAVLAAGYHYATIFGMVAAGTGTWAGAASHAMTAIRVVYR